MRQSQFAIFTDYKNRTLAFHSLSREFISFDIPFGRFTTAILENVLPPWVSERLENGHFIVPDDYDEYHEFLIDFRNKRYGPQNLVIYLTPSLKCNAGCAYCFQRDIRPNLGKQHGPDLRQLTKFVATKLHDAKGLQISWFGGEPLLQPQYIKEATAALKQLAQLAAKPYRASMVTNGLLLNDKTVDLLQDSEIDRLQISLDGTEDFHDRIGRRDGTRGFRSIINNLQRIPSSIRVAIRINVSRENLATIPALIESLSDFGLNRPNFTIDLPLVYNFSIDNDETNYSESGYVLSNSDYGQLQLRLLAFARALGFQVTKEDILVPGASQCHAVRSKGYSVWPDGSITRCIHEVSTPENLHISDDHVDINHAASLQKWLTTEVFETGPCRTCYFLPFCGGSCLHGRFAGLAPPKSCPPAKLTLKSRMQWYEAECAGETIPIHIDRTALVRDCERLAKSQTIELLPGGDPPSQKSAFRIPSLPL